MKNVRPIEQTYSAEERLAMLDKMRAARDAFYVSAVRVGYHQFVEIAGFMGELIKICEGMHEEGKDFGTNALVAKPHHMAYIAEKFDCIFGDALMSPEARHVFISTLALKGGWTRRGTEPDRSERERILAEALAAIREDALARLLKERSGPDLAPSNRLQAIVAMVDSALRDAEYVTPLAPEDWRDLPK